MSTLPSASRSMPDLALHLSDTEQEPILPSPTLPRAPPSPSPPPPPHPINWSRSPSPLSPSSSTFSHSSSQDEHTEAEGATPTTFHPSSSTPPTKRYDDEGEGDSPSYVLHHPERARSDYSIHSAPELGEGSPHLGGDEFLSADEEEEEGEEGVESPLLSSPTSVRSDDGEGERERGGGGKDEGRKGRRRRGLEGLQRLPVTLWDYLQEEVLAVEMDGEEGVKSERVTNFLAVPHEVEKIILFGTLICLDSFLYTFTILPLRTITAFLSLLRNILHNTFSRSASRRHLRLSHKCDLTKAVILAGALWSLNRITDTSKMYHGVRGQDTIKLYVLFNVLEIADRLCCSFGQDLQDSLFSRQTLGRRTDGSHPRIRPLALFGLNLAYVVAHTLVLFYQLVTLNVAINSYSNALLTLLLSNQFVEIKGSVFKKFEKENLFQLTCADIVERFQLALMLFIISLRNLIEYSSTPTTLLPFPILPSTLTYPTLTSLLPLLQKIFSPAIIVLISECFVDWLKHAFITKFNHIRPKVYGRFIDVLCKDLLGAGGGVGGRRGSHEQPFVDQSPLVSRRLGFAALPLGCLVIRVIAQAFEMLGDDSHVDECALPPPSSTLLGGGGTGGQWWKVENVGGWIGVGLVGVVGWACLIALKLLIGINLRAFASSRWSSMSSRLAEDHLNSRERPKIGVTIREEKQDGQMNDLLADETFDAMDKRRKVGLESLSRYDMIKSRLW